MGKDLSHETYVAPLFIFRLDKLAHEVMSYAGSEKILDDDGLPMETTRNGQRRDLGYMLAVAAKGLDGIFTDMTSHEVPQFIRRVAYAVQGQVWEPAPVSSAESNRTDYNAFSLPQLRDICRELGISGYYAKGIRKADIAEMIREKYPVMPEKQYDYIADLLETTASSLDKYFKVEEVSSES